METLGDKNISQKVRNIINGIIGRESSSSVWIFWYFSYHFTLGWGSMALVVWFEALKSIYQGLDMKLQLSESPKVENAENIIYCTILE